MLPSIPTVVVRCSTDCIRSFFRHSVHQDDSTRSNDRANNRRLWPVHRFNDVELLMLIYRSAPNSSKMPTKWISIRSRCLTLTLILFLSLAAGQSARGEQLIELIFKTLFRADRTKHRFQVDSRHGQRVVMEFDMSQILAVADSFLLRLLDYRGVFYQPPSHPGLRLYGRQWDQLRRLCRAD